MIAKSLALLAACALGYVTAQDAANPEPDTRKQIVHQVVKITGKETILPAEVSVTINPLKPEQVRAVSYSPRGSVLCSSEDGGKSWTSGLFPKSGNTRMQGDDLVVYGHDGRLHHACIRFVGIRERKPRRAENGIFTHIFDNEKWSSTVTVIDHVNTVEPFEDKPWLAVDSSPASKFKGNVYVSWTRFDAYGSKDPEKKSHLQFARSINGGKSFQPVERISETPGDCLDSSNTVMGGMPAVGPRGEVYVVWSGPLGVMLDRSLDGGNTFGTDMLVTKTPGGWDQPVPGVMRCNGMPVISVDTSSGPHSGAVYITWIDKRNGDMDLFCTRSDDQGKTWSAPVRINDDKQGNGKPQFFHWSTTDPADGSLNIVYYDRRSLEGTNTTMTLARSVDGGRTFTNFAVNQPAFECHADVFFGDYIGIAAHHGKLVAVYSHFTGRRELSLSAALFHFKPGTLETP